MLRVLIWMSSAPPMDFLARWHHPSPYLLYKELMCSLFAKISFVSLHFPDPAVIQGQYEYWHIGGGIISYRHATEILSIIASTLASMEHIHLSIQCKH
jgi:hypothetical protein